MSLPRLILVVLLLLVPGLAVAQESDGLKEARAELQRLTREVDVARADHDALGAAIKRASSLRTWGGSCVAERQADIDRLAQAIAAIGEAVVGESRDIARQRKELQNQKSRAEAQAAECRLIAVQAEEQVNRYTERQQSLLKERLALRAGDLFTVIAANLEDPNAWITVALDFTVNQAGFDRFGPRRLFVLGLFGGLGLAGGILLRRRLLQARESGGDGFAARLARAGTAVAARRGPSLGLLLGLSAALYATREAEAGVTFVAIAVHGVTAFAVALAALRAVLAPPAPARQVTALDDKLARALARRLAALGTLVLVGVLLFLSPLASALPEHVGLLSRAVFIAALVVNLGWMIGLVGHMPALARSGRSLRFVLLLVLAGVLLAEALGYRNLSEYVLLGLLQSGLVAAGLWLVTMLAAELVDGLDSGRSPWQAAVRERLGLEPDESFPGLVWLRFLLSATLWGGAALLAMRAWGLSDAGTALVFQYLLDGFTIGEMRIVPSKVLTGILVFWVALTLSRWLRDWIEDSWLARSRMDRGAREALVTVSGYVGFIFAVLLGLSTAGVDFTNLAIIASALSVGIGFGLQNVVSNFVAGIILLFERPIKAGDWVVVGNTEGYVKKIRVRATEIQTFDRSDVTVPNSDFITNQVTNWTLRDRHGRARVPIGVAYGSDTDLVRKVLLEVANEHPGILRHGSVTPPVVLFRAFGDSALNFELRFMLANVEDRLQVISDVNFAIDKAFRAHGISIPFPQRDLHIKSWPEPPPAPGRALAAEEELAD